MLTSEELIQTGHDVHSLRKSIADQERLLALDRLRLESLEDGIREILGVEDRIPGIGVLRRSASYRTALRLRTFRGVPSYEDEYGELVYLYRSRQYISKATQLGVGRFGTDLVLLGIVEYRRVKRAIRSDQNETE